MYTDDHFEPRIIDVGRELYSLDIAPCDFKYGLIPDCYKSFFI